MREEKKRQTITVYACEGCGKKSELKAQISLCEREHANVKCTHPAWLYSLGVLGQFAAADFMRVCAGCGHAEWKRLPPSDEYIQGKLAEMWAELKEKK
jgi:hypothetical protein